MIYLYIVTTLIFIVGLAIIYQNYLNIEKLSKDLDALEARLHVGINTAHSQVINAEKIIRDVPKELKEVQEILSVIGPLNKEIHDVCVWVSKEIQAAREASKV